MFNTIRTYANMAKAAKNMMKEESAVMHGEAFGKVIGLFIIAILIGSVFVAGLQQMATANTTGIPATQVALIAIVGLILVVGALWLILEYVGLV